MPNIIEVENLKKTFGNFEAVKGVSFAVEQGSTFGFLGPNGAGKSTTIKMLTTVLAPSEGRVLIAGHDSVKEPLEVRRAFGIVFQDPSLDDELTATENMELHSALYSVPRPQRRERVEALLRFVGLWERRDDYVKRFSGGMKRRLEIARALQHRPRVLFLDEPTVGLDPQTRNQIWGLIRDLCRNEGLTVFFSTHYMEEAERVADWIAVIDHGRIVAQGTAAATAANRRRHTGGRISRADGAQHQGSRGGASRSYACEASGVGRPPMNAVFILCLRQLKRYFRSRSRIIGGLGQPILFLLALGFGLGPMYARAGHGDYVQFLAPGIITMGILSIAVFSGVEIIWDRQFGFLKETLVAPAPRLEIVLGRTLGGATIALIQGSIVFLVCLLAGFRPADPLLLPLALLFMVLIAIMCTAIGTVIGTVLQDMQGFQLIMSFITMPLFFFSSALFPVPDLPQALWIEVLLNPLTYGVDGLRGALSGAFAFGVATDFEVLGGLTVILLAVGAYLFAKIEV